MMNISPQEMQQILETFGGMIAGVGIAVAAALLSNVILSLGIRWFIFQKAGQKGWKALIPIYSDYTYYKIAWSGRIYVILFICSILTGIMGAIFGAAESKIGLFVTLACSIALFGAYAIIAMRLQFKMAQAFGKNDYFAIGLYFLNSIFTSILAFGTAEYQGLKEQKRGKKDQENPPVHRSRQPQPRPTEAEVSPTRPYPSNTQARYAAPYAQQNEFSRQMNHASAPQNSAYGAYQQPAQQPMPRSTRRSMRNAEQGEG